MACSAWAAVLSARSLLTYSFCQAFRFFVSAHQDLPVTIPELPSSYQITPSAKHSSHPFSRSSHKPYRPDQLGYHANGTRERTEFFEQILVAIYWKMGRPVPYAFRIEGETRSLDAGCLGMLRSDLELTLDDDGYIAAVKPNELLLRKYEPRRAELLARIEATGNAERLDSAFTFSAIADEVAIAEQSQIERRTERLIERDLQASAMEGLTSEQKIKTRRRAAWLAEMFVRDKLENGGHICQDCGFDPIEKTKGTPIKPRSLLDVHHKRPLDEGVRVTTLRDFVLLCPTCHRFGHALARSQKQE
jgi:hypothetical protein